MRLKYHFKECCSAVFVIDRIRPAFCAEFSTKDSGAMLPRGAVGKEVDTRTSVGGPWRM